MNYWSFCLRDQIWTLTIYWTFPDVAESFIVSPEATKFGNISFLDGKGRELGTKNYLTTSYFYLLLQIFFLINLASYRKYMHWKY